MEDYKRYRWFYTSSKKLVIGGKSAKQNDQLVKKLKDQDQDQDYIAMHTEEPGSPFSIILTKPEKVSKEDLQETAIFTACFSRLWKLNKKSAKIHIFRLAQLHKDKRMKEGTWGLSGKIQKIKVQLELTIKNQKSTLRAVPLSLVNNPKVILTPGNIDKEHMLAKLEIELNHPLKKEEVLQALPPGRFTVKSSRKKTQ